MSKPWAFFGILLLGGCASNAIVLDGPSGKYEERYLGDASVTHLSVVVEVERISPNETWAPAAYVEFRDGKESPRKFRVIMFQQELDDEQWILGYEETDGDRIIARAPIGTVRMHARTRIAASFAEGRFVVTVNGARMIDHPSMLKSAVPLIRASNCVARFELSGT